MSIIQISQLKINSKYYNAIPRSTKKRYDEIKTDIYEKGQELPIIINQDYVILDGHTRYDICRELNIDPEINIKNFVNKLEEERFVYSVNIKRRDLNDFVHIELEYKIRDIDIQLGKQNMKNPFRISEKGKINVTKDIAVLVGKHTDTVSKAHIILEKAPDDLKERVRNGQTSINYAYKTVNRQEKKRTAKPIPQGEFSIILADPPWPYHINIRGSPDAHYDVMTLDEICKMKVPSADNSMLFLWATASNLREALLTLESWGFEYKTHLVWIKDKIGTGYYFRGQHELLLVGRKGDISIPEEKDRPNSVLQIPRTKHSKKPEEIYNIIERMYPKQKYLELFARNTRKNWHSWGDEL